jgi:hypothetical protein
MFYPRDLARGLYELGHETWVSITDNFSWQSKVSKHMFDVKGGCFLCCNILITWNEDCRLCTALVSDREY